MIWILLLVLTEAAPLVPAGLKQKLEAVPGVVDSLKKDIPEGLATVGNALGGPAGVALNDAAKKARAFLEVL
jgi:hypothetical protein